MRLLHMQFNQRFPDFENLMMMNCGKIVIAVAVLLGLCSGFKIVKTEIQSPSMDLKVYTIVILPDSYSNSTSPYNAIYFLHGYGGNPDVIVEKISIISDMADIMNCIMVLPHGNNSWYIDSPMIPRMKYETFISKELVAGIDLRFNTVKNRSGRVLMGLSMGGHGSFWNAVRHPDVFSACGSMEGGLDIRPFPENWSLKLLLGDESTHKQNWEDHTCINLIPQMKSGEVDVLMDGGYNDIFYDVSVKFHERMMQYKIDHDYYLRPGIHNYAYWNSAIQYQMLYMKKHFEKS